jgi:hypothetical protein
MSTISHTTHSLVTNVKVTEAPPNRSATGYGGKIPTRWLLRYSRRWRRVYMMQYGNAGSPYVVVDGIDHFLDLATEHMLEDVADDLAQDRTCPEKIENGSCIHSDHTP